MVTLSGPRRPCATFCQLSLGTASLTSEWYLREEHMVAVELLRHVALDSI